MKILIDQWEAANTPVDIQRSNDFSKLDAQNDLHTLAKMEFQEAIDRDFDRE